MKPLQTTRKTYTHERIDRETAAKAKLVAQRWGCTKMELYRWLIDLADEGVIFPDNKKPPLP